MTRARARVPVAPYAVAIAATPLYGQIPVSGNTNGSIRTPMIRSEINTNTTLIRPTTQSGEFPFSDSGVLLLLSSLIHRFWSMGWRGMKMRMLGDILSYFISHIDLTAGVTCSELRPQPHRPTWPDHTQGWVGARQLQVESLVQSSDLNPEFCIFV